MTKLRVSDHALVRYLERHYDLRDIIDQVRAEIQESVHAGHETCGDGVYPCTGGRAVVRSNVVTTFLPPRVPR